MAKKIKYIYSILYLLLIGTSGLWAGCDNKKEDIKIHRGELKEGVNTIVYNHYAPLCDKPITIYYCIPSGGDKRSMKILFAMHGADRNAAAQIETWKNIAEEKKVMVFAPLFTRELYPAERAYQYGGVTSDDNSYAPVPEDRWTISVIEAIFDFIKEDTGNTSSQYDLWGHSAGAQFVHRMMFFMPNARVRMAIASNAGCYMIPQIDGYGEAKYSFPFSLKGTPYTTEDVKKYLSRNMIVHLGTADKRQDSAFPKTPAAMAQGDTRFARGHYYFDQSEQVAKNIRTFFGWQIKEVPGVGHDSRNMVQASDNGAATLLYGK